MILPFTIVEMDFSPGLLLLPDQAQSNSGSFCLLPLIRLLWKIGRDAPEVAP